MRVSQLKSLFTDDEGVSPVIGVILMVAVTVILAAVIGAFVMNMGDNLSQSAPNANFEFEAQDDANSGTAGDGNYYVDVTHDGGDSFTNKNTKSLVVKNMATGNATTWANDAGHGQGYSINAGSTLTVGDGGFSDGDGSTDITTLNQGDEVKVIWTSDNGQSSQTVGQYTV